MSLPGPWGLFAHRRAQRSGGVATQLRRVRVDEGYDLPEIHVRAGLPIRLIFRREETAPCSECVVFPDLGIRPPFRDIAIDLPASGPGSHPFCCQMNTLNGSLIIEQDGSHDPHEAVAA